MDAAALTRRAWCVHGTPGTPGTWTCRQRLHARAATSSSSSSSSSSADKASLYFALGVSPGASAEACKRAYKSMAKRYHPDVCDVEEDIDMFLRAKAAYETLSAASGTCLDTVQTYEWKLKWRAQLEKLRAERAEAERARRERQDDNRISLVGTREMKNQIASQMAGLRDQTRKRRNVMKPTPPAFVEPFADIRASDDDEWNHEVQ